MCSCIRPRASTIMTVDASPRTDALSYAARSRRGGVTTSGKPDRALAMVVPAEVDGGGFSDPRVGKAVSFLVDGGHGSFDFDNEASTSREKFALQIAYYYAAVDIAEELGVTFMGIKCQDELSASYCTVCPAAAFLNNDLGPDGEPKRIVPVACENDMDSALTRLLLHLVTGAPAGFGDFRDIEDGVLAIINCGQHPQHFFGGPDEDGLVKLDRAEYPGQEHYYAAGGSYVRGRTPGGQTVTVARLGRRNLRYEMVATVLDTVDVQPAEHELYNRSWPILKGKVPVSDDVLIDVWPCNHLAFAFGDWTAALAEFSNRLDIGYRIFDRHGREFSKPY